MPKTSAQIVAGVIRVAPENAVLAGFGRLSRRYIDVASYQAIQAGKLTWRDVKTISNSAQRKLQNFADCGEAISKEERTKRLAGKGGHIPNQTKGGQYRTARAKEVAAYQERARMIRATVPEMIPKDVKLADKKNTTSWDNFSDKEKKDFAALFARYPPGQIRVALGSHPTMWRGY